MDNPNVSESGIKFKQQIFQSDTRQGVKFMFFALILVFIQMIVSTFTYIFSSFMTSEDPFSTSTLTASYFGYAISFLLMFFYFVLFLLAIYSFNRGRFELDEKHQKDVDLAKYFIISYVVIVGVFYLIISTLLIIFLPWDSFYIFPSLSQMVNIILSALIGFSILFLVRNFAGKFERELLYIFAFSLIVISIFGAIIELSLFSMFYSVQTSTAFSYVLIFGIIDILIWFLPLHAYNRILKGFETSGVYTPLSSKVVIPKPKRISHFVFRFYSRPMRSLLIILLIACVIAAGSGLSLRAVIGDWNREPACKPGPESLEPITEALQFAGTDSLTENSAEIYEYEIGGYIQEYQISLQWNDEPDLFLRTNDPDCFTLEIAFENESASGTGENPQGGMGGIVLKDEYYNNDDLWVDSVQITVTLDYAGDQLGPGGRQLSPLTENDNSNEFYFDISVVCCENL